MNHQQSNQDDDDFNLDPFNENSLYEQGSHPSQRDYRHTSTNMNYSSADLLRCTSLMDPRSLHRMSDRQY